MSDNDKTIWGYYSLFQANRGMNLIYELLDDDVMPAARSSIIGPVAWPPPNGPMRAVHVTMVKHGGERPETGLDDLVLVGRVGRCLRNARGVVQDLD